MTETKPKSVHFTGGLIAGVLLAAAAWLLTKANLGKKFKQEVRDYFEALLKDDHVVTKAKPVRSSAKPPRPKNLKPKRVFLKSGQPLVK